MRRLAMILALIPLAVAAVLVPAGSAFAREEKCLEYEPAVVRLTGIMRRHAAYEPPMYGEGPHDKLVHYWSLHLDHPICVNGRKEFNSSNPEDTKNIRQLEIFFSDYARGLDWNGRRVAITGTMFVAFGPRQHTEVLISAKKAVKLR